MAAAQASNASGVSNSSSSGKGARGTRCCGSSRDDAISSAAARPNSHQPRPLQHLTCLPIDLLQLQRLLHWAVLGPSCASRQAGSCAQQALQSSFTTGTLGVRPRSIGGTSRQGAVQVLGGCIADATEDASNQLAVLRREQQQWGQGFMAAGDGTDGQTNSSSPAEQGVSGAAYDVICGAKHTSTCSSSSSGIDSSSNGSVCTLNGLNEDWHGCISPEASACLHAEGLLPLGLYLDNTELWALLDYRCRSST